MAELNHQNPLEGCVANTQAFSDELAGTTLEEIFRSAFRECNDTIQFGTNWNGTGRRCNGGIFGAEVRTVPKNEKKKKNKAKRR